MRWDDSRQRPGLPWSRLPMLSLGVASGGRLAVDLALLALLAATFASGLLADGEGLNRFVVHRYTAYTLLGLAALHVFLERRALAGRLLRLSTLLQPGGQARARAGRHPMEGGIAPDSGQAQPAPPSQADRRRPARRDFLVAGGAALVGAVLARFWPRPEPPALTEAGDLGLTYHRWSAPDYAGAISRALDWSSPPAPERRATVMKTLLLPRDMARGGASLEEAIDRRRSARDYADRPLTLPQLSRLLHCAAGLTDPASGFRAAPSAGALYPLETYAVVNKVSDLGRGLYRYVPGSHALELLRDEDLRLPVLQACLGQQMVASAGVVVVLTAVFQRTRWKYGERAYRYVLLEAGHVGQNLYLAATALGLGACAIGAFRDEELNRLLGIDGVTEATLYVVAVGIPARS